MTTEITGAAILAAIADTNLPAYVEQTGGGCATVYVGPVQPATGRYQLAIGPGAFNWTDADASTFDLGDCYVGPDDEGESTAERVDSLAELADEVRRQAISRVPGDDGTRAPGHVEAIATCAACGRSWDDAVSTSCTPTPSGRCPWEADHVERRRDDDHQDVAPFTAARLPRVGDHVRLNHAGPTASAGTVTGYAMNTGQAGDTWAAVLVLLDRPGWLARRGESADAVQLVDPLSADSVYVSLVVADPTNLYPAS